MTTWRLLFVDDDVEICKSFAEHIELEPLDEEDGFELRTLSDFSSALGTLESEPFDLLILDVRLGPFDGDPDEEAGTLTLETIRNRRFIPVIFYTGLPGKVSHLTSQLIRVVEKTEGFGRLIEEAREVISTKLPSVNRAIMRHVEEVQRVYMWDFVAKHWAEIAETPDKTALAYLLARRLAMSLSQTGIDEFIRQIGGEIRTSYADSMIHAMQYYIMPPVGPTPMAGDIYADHLESEVTYSVVLTPSCDFAQNKAERVLLARASLLSDQKEYKDWLDDTKNEGKLKSLLKNSRQGMPSDRYHFLPSALDIPGLILDFQDTYTISLTALTPLKRLASLDSPFAEALLSRFVRYMGRLGTPDLNVVEIVQTLRQS